MLPHSDDTQAPSSLLQLGESLRKDFPILDQQVNGKPLIYFDNAATSQKPHQVVQALERYYEGYNSNVHRGVHTLSARATTEYELARDKLARFVNARTCREIVYTRNASEAINLVAYSWGMNNLKAGDEVRPGASAYGGGMVGRDVDWGGGGLPVRRPGGAA